MSVPWSEVARVDGVAVTVHDSIQVYDPRAAGAVAISGSHTGVPASTFGAAQGVIALIGNDAGGGKDDAGIAGLAALESYGVATAAVDHDSARIGDGRDTYENGIVSAVNRFAASVGVRPGMRASDAALLLATWRPPADRELPTADEAHHVEVFRGRTPRIVAIDSASQITPEFAEDIVFTGSHGGAVGGVGVRHRVGAAFFNDAGIGKDDAGTSRLPLLDRDGIPGATIDYLSACIGFGAESYEHGVLSRVNEAAERLGLTVGMPSPEAGRLLVEALARP